MNEQMKEKTKKKRDLILKAALCVFLQNGYEKTKIIDIAQKAGIGKGTVYEYFKSKEELFHCLLDICCQSYQEVIQSSLSKTEGKPFQAQLLAMLCAEREFEKDIGLKSVSFLQFHMEFIHVPQLNQAFFSMMKFKFDTLCQILKDGVLKGELRPLNIPYASILLMGAWGISMSLSEKHPTKSDSPSSFSSPLYWLSDQERESLTDQDFLDLIMHGFCAPEK